MDLHGGFDEIGGLGGKATLERLFPYPYIIYVCGLQKAELRWPETPARSQLWLTEPCSERGGGRQNQNRWERSDVKPHGNSSSRTFPRDSVPGRWLSWMVNLSER